MIFYNILRPAKFKIYWVGAARPSRLRISRTVPIEDLALLVFGKSIVYPQIDIEPVFNCYHQQHRELNLIWLGQVLKAICERFCRKYSPKNFSYIAKKINAHKALKKINIVAYLGIEEILWIFTSFRLTKVVGRAEWESFTSRK